MASSKKNMYMEKEEKDWRREKKEAWKQKKSNLNKQKKRRNVRIQKLYRTEFFDK